MSADCQVAVFRFPHRPFICAYKTALPHEMEEKDVVVSKESTKLSFAWFSSLDNCVVPSLSELRVNAAIFTYSILFLALR